MTLSAQEKYRRGIQGALKRSEGMKCPLFCQGMTERDLKDPSITTDCLEEECAWWDMIDKSCVIFRQSRTLLAIENRLAELVKKGR